MIDLEELERLARQATPLPWADEGIGYIRSPSQKRTIAECMPPICRGLKNIQQHGINAAYIVAACNELPKLIERVRELEAENADLRRELKAALERS